MNPRLYVCTVTYGDVRQRFFASRSGIEVITDVQAPDSSWHERWNRALPTAYVPSESVLVDELLRTRAYPQTTRALLQTWQRVRQLYLADIELIAEVVEVGQSEPLHVVLHGEPS